MTADPRATTEAPAIIATSQLPLQTPTTPASDVQATLLALLGQAAQVQVNGHSEPPRYAELANFVGCTRTDQTYSTAKHHQTLTRNSRKFNWHFYST